MACSCLGSGSDRLSDQLSARLLDSDRHNPYKVTGLIDMEKNKEVAHLLKSDPSFKYVWEELKRRVPDLQTSEKFSVKGTKETWMGFSVLDRGFGVALSLMWNHEGHKSLKLTQGKKILMTAESSPILMQGIPFLRTVLEQPDKEPRVLISYQGKVMDVTEEVTQDPRRGLRLRLDGKRHVSLFFSSFLEPKV